MCYREVLPHPRLRPWVRFLWYFRKGTEECGLDRDFFCPEPYAHWMFIYRGAYYQAGEGGRVFSGSVASFGQRNIMKCDCPGEILVVGVCFYPGGTTGLGLFDSDDVRGIVPWDHPWALGITEDLARIPDESDMAAWFCAIERRLLDRIPAGTHQACPMVCLMNNIGHDTRVDCLAKAMGCSCRHLERWSRVNTGYAPREFKSVMAVSRARRWMFANTHVEMSDVALDLGFCDQAHFNRVFKTWTGIPPGEYRRVIQPWQRAIDGEKRTHECLVVEGHGPICQSAGGLIEKSLERYYA